MRILPTILAVFIFATSVVAEDINTRLRSYDDGREDAMMGFITSGPRAGGDQSTYDTGYREEHLRRTIPQGENHEPFSNGNLQGAGRSGAESD
jgi:hypothetical protein